MGMEKASLHLAVALLELASQPACYDPFACLQQAAMFASQASKAGNSDVIFRKSLPEIEDCAPLEALNVLGRADCLHSVFFPNEAAYLCSYVARVCRLHRDREQPDHEWDARWKIVAIYGYNVSVMIRATVSTVLDKNMQKSFLSMWERDVVEELERGRSDGWSWKRSLYPSSLELPPEKAGFEDLEAEEEGDDDEVVEEQDVEIEADSDTGSIAVDEDEDEKEVDEQSSDSDSDESSMNQHESSEVDFVSTSQEVCPLSFNQELDEPIGIPEETFEFGEPTSHHSEDSDDDSMKDIVMVSV
jgi:hypothetical protein